MSSSPRILLVSLLVLLPLFAVVLPASADEAAARRDALRRAEEPLRARQWGDAVSALRGFRQRHPGTEEAREAWILEARALLQAGTAREALNETSTFLKAHGESAWAGRMRATAADAYVRLGRAKEAAAVLRERVEATTAPAARAAIGALHVRLADEDFDGVETKDDLGRTVKKRNVARALQAYEHARDVGVPEGETLRVRERVALCLEELKRYAEAAAGWDGLLQGVEKGTWLADSERHERWLVGRGRARLRAGERDLARKDLRDALAQHPSGPQHMEILLLLGEERLLTAAQTNDVVAFEEGVTWMRRAILEHRDDERAAEAQKQLAIAYESRGQSEKAAAEWGALAERFPKNAFVPEALDRQAQNLVRAGLFPRAIEVWQRFLSAYPNHPLWPTIRGKIVQAAFAEGEVLAKAEDVAGAVRAWRAFAERYPADARAPQALVRAGRLLSEQKDFDAALALWAQVAGRYASTPQAPTALWLEAWTLENDLDRLDDAVKAYEKLIEKHPRTKEAGEAAGRLGLLKTKHLELRMERVQGTDAPPRLEVTTRNIEALDVRVYRLDMEEYFRRKGTVRGVENLQLEVVKPDEKTAWKLDDYRPFVLTQAERPVPVKGAGAYVVVAGDEDLTATVLFIVSDAEIVVKRARRRDLLVWAFDRDGQTPLPGARVLMSQGGKVRELGKTGPDGVWHGEKGGDAEHVLVLSGKGLAATEIGSGPAVSAGFQSKAHVVTDRPVYRPGQEVHWRAILLRASGGGYQPPKAFQGTVRVLDARGQTLFQRNVRSTVFGTFSGTFALDAEARLGTWKVQVSVKHVGTWTGDFEVQAFRKPELTIELVPDRPVYLTGEKVKATALVTYAFGGPVADAAVQYEIYRQNHTFEPTAAEDHAWYFAGDEKDRSDEKRKVATGGTLVARGETRTDDGGTTVLEFETAERDEDAWYLVRVAVEDVTRRWIVDQDRIPVTRRDHMAVVKTTRKVYRPKQEARVEVRTVDALERPVPRTGSLLLLELRRRVIAPEEKLRGRPVPVRDEEVERAVYPVSTGATGSAEIRLALPGPGRWRLRWRATDGRGALVTAFADVEASGEAEDLSRDARLVAAKSVTIEGNDAEVLLQSPVTGVTALLTYEGEKILAYRFVRIEGRSTLLALPVGAQHAPNVFFKIAIPAEGRLLEADTEVVVLRHLEVDVAMPKVSGPGRKVEIEVTTRDAQGRPVAAEVGLALIDETLFAIAADRAPAIRPYFYDRKRKNAVTTTTSIGFAADGTTRATNKDLLADEAARSGDMQKAMALGALRNAREALRRGDVRTAAVLALRAAEADPASFEARAFLSSLREDADVRKKLERADRAVMDELKRMAPMEEPALADMPAGSPRPRASFAAKEKGEAGADMEDELESVNEVIGLGGGAGGSFRGRGGRRDLRAGGGGRARKAAFASQLSAELLVSKSAHDKMLRYPAATREALGLDAFATIDLRQRFADTAAWAPHLVTGEDGKGSLEVELPDNLTTWRAIARGVSRQALVGEGRARMLSRKDLLVRVDTPRFLVQGDDLVVPVAAHNETGARQEVQVRLEAEGVELGGEDASLDLQHGQRGISDRDMRAEQPGRVRVEATATAGASGDRTEVRFATLPRGIKVVEGRTGVVDTARGALQETFVEVPEGAIPGATRLAVVVYPGVDAALLDALLYLELYPYGCIEQIVHRFLPALDARVALRQAGSPAAARLDVLDEAVRRGALRLRNLQNADGTFGWFRGGSANLAMTAYALLGLAGAREAGVADLDRAIENGAKALTGLVKAGDEDARALGHLALATVGRLDQETYASTFRRRRDDLSVSGLAWLAMAAGRRGRGYDADELVRLILERRVEKGGMTSWPAREGDCFVGSAREATGLAVRALLEAGAETPHAERGLQWLLANRTEGRFGTTKDTAAFVAAAAAWVKKHGAQGFGGSVDILLDGATVRKVPVGREGLSAGDRRFLLEEAAEWAAGRHRIGFRLDGQGRLHWALRLVAVVVSEDLPADTHGLTVDRTFLRPEEAAVEGQPAPIKPGYGVLRPAARPRVEAKPLELVESGDRVLVRLEISAPRDLDYVLIEDPLPAGFDVLEGTAAGEFDWQERRDDRQVFFLTKVKKGKQVLRYVLQATHWGSFTALGTTAYAMYLPEVHGRAAGTKLVVSREPLRGADVERGPTPDEIYERAKRLFADGKLAEATALFRALAAEQPLRDEIIEEIESYHLRAAIEAGDEKEIVRAREALVRRNPSRIGGDWRTARAIAFAYDDLGEAEVASGLYRDLLARGFGLRTDWTETLTSRGEEVRGLDELGRSLRSFPVSNATAAAAFRRAQRYRELPRPAGRTLPSGRPMDVETLDALYAFTAHFAETRLADPANYAVVGALRRAGDLEGAAVAAEAFLERFPKSPYLDDALYFLAESRFRTFEAKPDAAHAKSVRAAARPLVDDTFPGPDGKKRRSEFRVRAIHLLARVHHVLGELDEAVRLYWAARSLEDAREAHAFLTKERLDLPKMLEAPIDGGAALPIGYRNVATVRFKAYPVDLQVLFAVRKTLEGLPDVDLSGIVPVHEWEATFEDGKDHRGHEGEVRLPVEEGKPGAWLVVAKAGDHEAKTLVLKSDLKVVLQRIDEKVRVNVTDAAGLNVRDAYVTVSDGQRIRARGLTDGRGVFEAPGVGKSAAVVVSKDDRYGVAR